jgi:NAD(P)-dependent dehydrogenase (short-subunit alcohol dehydrogenase family)
MEKNIKGQRVIIMGGTSGIGLASVRMLVEMGAEVVITIWRLSLRLFA